MKSKFWQFLYCAGNNLQRHTFMHVAPGRPKRRKRLLAPRSLASLIIPISVLVIVFALLPTRSTRAIINGFSTNQELPLPALAPIGPAPVAFIVRGLEPSVRVAPDGAVYVSSIRGVPGGVDLHRYFAATDGPPGVGGTYPFKYEGQPDNCGILANRRANNSLDPLGLGLGGAAVDLTLTYPPPHVPNPSLSTIPLAPAVTATHSPDRAHTFS